MSEAIIILSLSASIVAGYKKAVKIYKELVVEDE